MTNTRLTQLCKRILFWSEKIEDLQKALDEALDTIKRTDVDMWKDINWIIAERKDNLYQFCIYRLKTAKNDLRFELTIEKETEDLK